MRLLTKYNTQGWVLSGGHVGECAELLAAQGQALLRLSEEGFLALTLTLSQRERGLMGCGF